MNNANYNPLIGPWREILNSIRFVPSFTNKKIQNSIFIGNFYEKEGKEANSYDIWVSNRAWDKLIRTSHRIWVNQLDNYTFQGIVKDRLKLLRKESEVTTDITQVKESLQTLINEIESSIKERLILVGIRGLVLPSDYSYSTDRFSLLANDENSLLRLASSAVQKRFEGNKDISDILESVELVDSFLMYKFKGHYKRGMQDAFDQTIDLLEILRLYVGSNYSDVREGKARFTMGIVGLYPAVDPIPLLEIEGQQWAEESATGFRFKITPVYPINVTRNDFTIMETYGLLRLLNIFSKVRNGDLDSQELRIFRAVTWFAKGTQALWKEDSYLSYAIAIESLLSLSNSHPQSTYAKQIAAILSNTEDSWFTVPDDRPSPVKATRLPIRGSMDKNLYYMQMKQEIGRLIETRHSIVHGSRMLSQADNQALGSYEAVVRNVILQYLKEGWESLEKFETWRNQSFPDQETSLSKIRNYLRIIENEINKILKDVSLDCL